ncbi:MAG: hypothetical protein A2845_03560 [Candidatus Lloydbacteria bacterium RIFCSPHIGHO2_01_FULL_49_22]|uniref:Metal-dependent hydrolase n=1 Tax=Candidatus Lloydbacteria bacterium RIFCSPHIGHO2_01_FULL_49_22 TaxID=1798658 RepID=A0A1G2CWV9_9BACT|nr:MAG: hypothetical protein A2845_03560 [Candidatus Lloydbacteria bacterium RIFCSPHIGHO2_01_FULL_49_22]OGZ09006.1 MAG: hypothetical protein A3C14_03395 [Candidatus Lloydbacteria bacterium RIFCSPHIGHO2_02_FULL_50_18]
MDTQEKKILVVTHSGRFHADEVMAVAALELFFAGRPYEVVRSRDPKMWGQGNYVVDVGGEFDPVRGRFDHHQAGGAGTRPDGTPYSSFGAVWKFLGTKICNGSAEVSDRIERKLGYPIDMADNGIEVYKTIYPGIHPYILHQFVGALNSTWKEGDKQTERFVETVSIFKRLLEREILVTAHELEGAAIVRKLYENSADKRLIVMDDQYPNEVLSEFPEPLFVVKPARQTGNWEVECVRNDAHGFENRKSLPKEWGGKFAEELAVQTGVPDAVFCHRACFLAVAGSKDGAIALAKIALLA